MDYLIITGAGLLILLIVMIGFYQWHKKKTNDILEELTLFKKEKEYYSEAMMVLSESYDVVFANKSAKALFSLNDSYHKLANGNLIGLKIDTSDPADFFDVLKKEAERKEDSFHLQNVLLTINGKMQQVNIYVDKSGWNIDKTITCVIDMQVVTPTEVKTVKKDGGEDFFTGLPSQFSALSDINTLVVESKNRSESFALLLLGIDHFKELQNTLGPGFSNQVIKKIANYFETNTPENMSVYRMDCDKFLLILKNENDQDIIRQAAKNIILDIKNFYQENETARLTTSIGISMYPEHGENATKLLHHVYIALEEAQKDSESNISFFEVEIQAIHKDEVKMNEEIRKGLKHREFFLYYQPIFNLKSEEMIGAEALIRWKHPELGLISADKFLDIAKKTGLIVEIGEYAFREAIMQRKQWNEQGLKSFKITLNLSLKEMQVDTFISKLKTLFEDHGVSPQDFNLDITERAAMANMDKTVMDFKMFKDLGLSISLDNFGASYSSLKHLQALPLSSVKIDRSLIFDLETNLDHQITVKSIIGLIHGFGFEASAEGVETSKELQLLSSYGCDHAQGYLYSKPLSAIDFGELLR